MRPGGLYVTTSVGGIQANLGENTPYLSYGKMSPTAVIIFKKVSFAISDI